MADPDIPPLASRLRVRAKVWLEDDQRRVLISDFRARLLAEIERAGSVAAAARALGLPYRTAWKKLQEMEDLAGTALLESVSGGASGGKTRLTAEARGLLRAFRKLTAPIEAAVGEDALREPAEPDEPRPPRRRRG